MSEFKNFTQGLFEILLPGSFLLLNIVAFLCIATGFPPSMQMMPGSDKWAIVATVPILGASYILGMVLRMFRTENPDRVSAWCIRHWPLRFMYFLIGDITDLPSLAKKLSERSNQDEVTAYLVTQLSPATLILLREYQPSASSPVPLQLALLNDFNKVIKTQKLHEKNLFTGVGLREETNKLFAKKPQKLRACQRLNRLLLEETYAQELSRDHDRYYKEHFFYPKWLEERYVPSLPPAAKEFFDQLWGKHYYQEPGPGSRNPNTHFFNFIKTLLLKVDKDTYAQLAASEAVCRFVASSFWALLFSVGMLCVDCFIGGKQSVCFCIMLLFVYLVVLLGICFQFRFLRCKEVSFVFDASFAYREEIMHLLKNRRNEAENEYSWDP
jgi:hypothetical protein